MKLSKTNAIEVQNVTKIYGSGENSVTALDNANLIIYDNEFFTLLIVLSLTSTLYFLFKLSSKVL